MAQEDGQAVLKHRLHEFLQKREPPKTFCPSEVARSLTKDELSELGFAEWREAMQSIRELAWHSSQAGACEITQKGEPIADDAELEDIRGPIRIRRTADRT